MLAPCLLLLLLASLAPSAAATGLNEPGQCVWYGKCGADPAWPDDGGHILNCHYAGPPKPATPAALKKLAQGRRDFQKKMQNSLI